MTTKQPILIATIGAPHGVKGEVRVKSFAEDPLAIADYGLLRDRSGRTFKILKARPSKSMLVVRFDGIETREVAEALRNLELYIDRSALPAIEEEDEFYLSDLIGLEVRNADNATIGKVKDVPNFGADDMLEIEPDRQSGGNSYYLPFTKACVPAINLNEGWIIIEPPEEIIVRDPGK